MEFAYKRTPNTGSKMKRLFLICLPCLLLQYTVLTVFNLKDSKQSIFSAASYVSIDFDSNP